MDVWLITTGTMLGRIAWVNSWRQYAYHAGDVVLSLRVLAEMRQHLAAMMRTWAKHGPARAYDGHDYGIPPKPKRKPLAQSDTILETDDN